MSPTAGLPGLAVARPISVLMSLAALLVVGVIAQRALPVQLLPTGFDPPFLWVWVPTLPAAPADNERDVAIPVEDALATMPGLASFRSAVRADAVNFRLELSNETDVDSAYQQVRDRLDRVTPTLPEGAQRGYIWRHDPNGRPVAIYGVVYPPGTEDPHEVLDRKIGRAIERLPGVSSVELWGVPERQVRVEIDDGAARAHGVDLGQLARKLGADNFTLALGAIEPGGRRSLVRALSRFSDLETLRALPVAEGVTLADVATVHFAPDPEPVINRIDGRNAATLAIFKESTANTIEVSALVAARLDALMTGDPELQGYESTPFFDQGAYIDRSIDELQTSALIGGLIAVALLFAFLRSVGMTFIVSVAIPLCLLSTLIVLYFNGDSLDVMSMMGLMLSVGMVIDNAIVVLENIDRHRALGSPIPSVSGAREVSLAITLATLTTMVVFLPLILLGGEPMLSFYLGKIGFPVCYALGASLFVALVYIPAGAHALGRRTGRKPTASSFRWLQTL
ncbi:MAG: efflux RND transporter permease subunit, partial [Myxococcales bacterium]|nr:efflux RND transporter permease subunit [Myxococcales bacterium]